MTKKIISVLLALACILSVLVLSSCGDAERNVGLKLNGVAISNDVMTYFLDKAHAELEDGEQYEATKAKTVALASTYFKINSYAHEKEIVLNTAQKASVSEKVNAYWGIYGDYYTKIGVTKQTLTKVFTADAYKDELILDIYGEGGEKEVQLARLYAQFRTQYIVFQAINGYFTKVDNSGNSVRLSDNEIEAIVLKYQNMATLINAGERTMDEAADFLEESGYESSVQTVILSRDDNISYPAGFFDRVSAIEPRIATVIGTSENIFLVLKGEVDATSSYFTEKKTDMIREIVGDEIDITVEQYADVEAQVDDSVMRAYFSLIG